MAPSSGGPQGAEEERGGGRAEAEGSGLAAWWMEVGGA